MKPTPLSETYNHKLGDFMHECGWCGTLFTGTREDTMCLFCTIKHKHKHKKEKVMKTYIGTKQIEAKPIKLGKYNDHRGWIIPPDEDPERDGFLITYPDGYVSWSPKEAFEAAYRKNGELDFGMALFLLKQGKKIRLPYWSEDVFLTIQEPDDNSKMTHPYIYVTSRFGLVPWVATQVEMLSEKWSVID